MFGQYCDADSVETIACWLVFLGVCLFFLGYYGRMAFEPTEDEVIDEWLNKRMDLELAEEEWRSPMWGDNK